MERMNFLECIPTKNGNAWIRIGIRASRVENQDAIDAAMVGMLADPKEVFFFLSFNLMEIDWVLYLVQVIYQ